MEEHLYLDVGEDPGGEEADSRQEGGNGRHADGAAHAADGVGHTGLPDTVTACICYVAF